MARQIIWTQKAQNDRLEIFLFWNSRNKSVIYSKKLNELFKESLLLICKYPLIGMLTNKENVRINGTVETQCMCLMKNLYNRILNKDAKNRSTPVHFSGT